MGRVSKRRKFGEAAERHVKGQRDEKEEFKVLSNIRHLLPPWVFSERWSKYLSYFQLFSLIYIFLWMWLNAGIGPRHGWLYTGDTRVLFQRCLKGGACMNEWMNEKQTSIRERWSRLIISYMCQISQTDINLESDHVT